MWIRQLLLIIIGLSAGMGAAIGLFAFIIGLGVISDLADRTHTGRYVMLYEDCVVAGGVLGNIFFVFNVSVAGAEWMLFPLGLLCGIFVGCWAMALAEQLKVFPILVRRGKLIDYIPWLIFSVALGKMCGELLFFYMRW